MRDGLRAGVLFLMIAASGCYDPPDIHVGIPDGPPMDKEGWAIWSIPDPMLVLVEDGSYKVMMRCLRSTWNVELNEPPVSGAAQPPMIVEVNNSKWTGVPREKIVGGASPFVEAKIVMGGENPSRDTLVEGLRRNTGMRLTFNGVDRALPPIPADLGARVGGYCLKML
jgi:hypothetical protein